jgi:predicted ferric reductase
MDSVIEFSSELKREPRRDARKQALMSGSLVALTGLVSTGALWVVIARLQARGASAGAIAMSDMNMRNMGKFWAFPLLQSSGLTGLGFAYLSVLLGLQQSARGLAWLPMTYRQIDRLHRQISLLVIGLVLVHVVATALDAMGDSWRTVLIPGEWSKLGWPQAVWGYNLGIIALYVLALVAPTFYLRRRIGTGRWRFLHRFVLVFYAFSVWHALILGVDIGHYTWIQPTIWLLQIPLLALFIRRLLRPARSGKRLQAYRQPLLRVTRYGLIALSATAIIGILAVVVTGHAAFIETV